MHMRSCRVTYTKLAFHFEKMHVHTNTHTHTHTYDREWSQVGQNSGLHVIILDEFDAFTRTRGSLTSDGSGVRDSIVNQLLSKIDGVCMYVCMYVCMFNSWGICVCVCVYACLYVCMYVYMYICMYVQ
jgi:hypothetical protein